MFQVVGIMKDRFIDRIFLSLFCPIFCLKWPVLFFAIWIQIFNSFSNIFSTIRRFMKYFELRFFCIAIMFVAYLIYSGASFRSIKKISLTTSKLSQITYSISPFLIIQFWGFTRICFLFFDSNSSYYKIDARCRLEGLFKFVSPIFWIK